MLTRFEHLMRVRPNAQAITLFGKNIGVIYPTVLKSPVPNAVCSNCPEDEDCYAYIIKPCWSGDIVSWDCGSARAFGRRRLIAKLYLVAFFSYAGYRLDERKKRKAKQKAEEKAKHFS